MAIYVPSPGPDAWQQFLAEPERQWRTGYSARTLAHSWEAARGLPPEIDAVLGGGAELLLAIPEHKVPLPGGQRASQCDVFALVRQGDKTISLAVEGKVDESFGPLLSDWLAEGSSGKEARLRAIAEMLGCTYPPPGALYYQLFHRTAAAIVEARRFKTDRAAMIVHSFSPTAKWFDAFVAFAAFLGADSNPAQLVLPDGMPITLGWAKGYPAFLKA